MLKNIPSNSYNDMPYVSHPFQQTHPDRLATIARLLNLSTPEVKNCKVLEIGCASGNNLIPMAEQLPEGRFLGIDYAENQIAAGHKVLKNLELPNLELRCQSIIDFNEPTNFDFIIVHGVYSWVPKDVQEKILEICKKNLSPDGIAYVSYNVLPGWHMRGIIRDMVLYHTRNIPNNNDKIIQAKAVLEFVAKSSIGENNPYSLFIKNELEIFKQQNDSYLFHELLDENNYPIYFHEFNRRANQQGLMYLADTDMRSMSTRDLKAEAQKELQRCSSIIETEQYLDFIRNRMFRSSLLVHQGKTPNYNMNPSMISNFHISSTLVPTEQNMNLTNNTMGNFSCKDGSTLSIADPLMKATLVCLQEAWPCSLSINEIIEKASKRIGLEIPQTKEAKEKVMMELGKLLIGAYTSLSIGTLELTTREIKPANSISSNPKILKVARSQAIDGLITNNRHQSIKIGNYEICLINMLDGKNNLDEIVQNFEALVQNNQMKITTEGNPLALGDAKSAIRKKTEEALNILMKNGLLTA